MKNTERQKPGGRPKAVGATIATVGALVVFSGCAVGPNYQRPPVIVPENFRFESSPAPLSLGQLGWWEVFKDATLQELIRTALTNNYDLKQAVARVEQARNMAVAAGASFYPQIGYGGDVGRGRNALINMPTPLNGATESSAQANLNAVWEIDLWGRIRRLSESARAQYLATEEARRGVTLTLVSEVATAYFQLLQYDQELTIQRAATKAYTDSYRIFDEREKTGAASKLEPTRAAAALANAAALIPELELKISSTSCLAAPPVRSRGARSPMSRRWFRKSRPVCPANYCSAGPMCARPSRRSSPPMPAWAPTLQTASRRSA
jgi:multidrug efflux system outer membrane protein